MSIIQPSCIVLNYVNVNKLYKFKMVCSQKLIWSLADVVEYIYQIKNEMNRALGQLCAHIG